MKSRPTKFGYTTSMNLPARPGGYGDLRVTLMPILRPEKGHYLLDMPVPVLITGRYGPCNERLQFKFQSNWDSPHRWYGVRSEWDAQGIPDTPVILAWLTRHAKTIPGDARELVEYLSKHALHIAYSCQLSQYVEAPIWERAEEFRTYYEVGAKASADSGCCINVQVHKELSDDAITRAVSRKLRESGYCSDEEFRRWLDGGSRWEQGYIGSTTVNHRPLTPEEMFGKPADEAAD